MNFFSTFTGIGLIDLGLGRAGWRCVGQCEIEPFGQIILEKHWPNIWRWGDVRTLTGQLIYIHCGPLDAFVGGIPCQPASIAGERRGADDDRWFWPDYLRVVSEINDVQEKPLLWLLAENPDDVLSLRIEGHSFHDWIANQFQSLGYSLFIGKFGADCVGAPHERQRVWLVAHRNGERGRPELAVAAGAGLPLARQAGERKLSEKASQKIHDRPELSSVGVGLANADSEGQSQSQGRIGDLGGWPSDSGTSRRASALADALRERLQEGQEPSGSNEGISLPADDGGYPWPAGQGQFQYEWEEPREIRDSEIKSSLGLANNGRATRLARRWRNRAIEAIGNGAVVAAAEAVGRAILQAHRKSE